MNPQPPLSDSPGATGCGGGVRPLDWARAAGAEDLVEREMRAQVRRRRRRTVVTGAAALAVLVAGFLWQIRPVVPPVVLPTVPAFVTAPVRQVLPDGSVVDLKSGADIAVDYTGAMRRVWLREGEAHFQVAKNPHRPFVVVARGVEVRAVGTAFSVELARANVDVLVTEGLVAVESHPSTGLNGSPRQETIAPAHSPAPTVFVDAGHRVSIDTTSVMVAAPTVQPVAAQEIADRLAWRETRLELNFTPLSEVIAVVNQQGSSRLTLAESDLGTLQLSGSLRASNVPVLLQILETSYGVTAERCAHGEIVLRRAR